ncbi:hypothetical protein AAY473_007930 [Plecturocebus cupreus]
MGPAEPVHPYTPRREAPRWGTGKTAMLAKRVALATRVAPLPGICRCMGNKNSSEQSYSVAQAGVQWHELNRLQPPPPGFKSIKAITWSKKKEPPEVEKGTIHNTPSPGLIKLGDRVSLCPSVWSAVVQSQLTEASNSGAQAILLPPPPNLACDNRQLDSDLQSSTRGSRVTLFPNRWDSTQQQGNLHIFDNSHIEFWMKFQKKKEKHFKILIFGAVRRLMPVIPALWEAEAGGSPEFKSSLANMVKPLSLLKIQKLAGSGGMHTPVIPDIQDPEA